LFATQANAFDGRGGRQSHHQGGGLPKIAPINSKAGRYQPDDGLLAFLKGLSVPPDYAESAKSCRLPTQRQTSITQINSA
jgi:hypothetical protein